MTDRPETQRSFEAPPTSLRARRRDPLPVLVAIAVVLFIAVAVVKPWGAVDPATTRADDAEATRADDAEATRADDAEATIAAGPSTPPDSTSAPTLDPAFEIELAKRSPDVDGRAPHPVGPSGDPVTAAARLVADLATRAGTWGIGAGGWTADGAGGQAWTVWRETRPKRPDDPAVLLGYVDRERVCETDPHLQGGATVLAVTSPPGIRPDWVLEGWVVAPDGTTVVTPRIRRITSPASDGGFSAIVFADGSPWADGIYRLLVEGRDTRLAIDVCLGSGSPGMGSRAAATPTDGIIRTITGGLVGRSGEWGIGAGGPDGSGGGAWVVWRAATPVSEDRSIGIRPPPSCLESPGGSTRIRPGLVIALTVPAGLPPDWTAEAVRFDGRGRATFDGTTRQVTPPGNRGIAYLIRSDGSAWSAGAYRFRVTTSTRSLSFDACLASS